MNALKVKLKFFNGEVKEYIAEDIRNNSDLLKIFLPSGSVIVYPWEKIKDYESTKINPTTLEKIYD